MPQDLQKCFDENNNEVKGWRWDVDSQCLYHYRQIDKKHLRFSTGVKCDPLDKREDADLNKLPWPRISQAAFNKAVREANAEVTRRMRAGLQSTTIKPLLREIIANIKKRYESKPIQPGKKNHTLYAVKNAFSKLEEFWGTLFPEDITAKKWDEFQDWWDDKYPGFNSFNVTKYMRVLRSECIELGYLKIKPTINDRNAKTQKIKRKKKKGWVYKHSEILALDDACVSDMERIILRLGYQNAFRISDALNVEWSKFKFNTKIPAYKFDEEDKEETKNAVPITEELAALVKAHTRTPGSPFLFPQKSNPNQPLKPQQFDFEAIKTRANINRGTFHSLRHYRLSVDFKNPKLTAAQVCLMRRITLATASEHYIHSDPRDLELLQNTGSLDVIRGLKDEDDGE